MNTTITTPKRFSLDIRIENHIDLIDALASHTNLSKQQLKKALVKGCVWLQTTPTAKVIRVRRAKKMLSAGNVLSIHYDEAILNQEPPSPTLIVDCKTFSVWYKPKGMLSQGSKWADHTTLSRWVEMHRPFDAERPCFVVHRLDRATDGLMLLAHTQSMAKQLTQAFMGRQISKIYQAGVIGCFDETPHTFSTPIDDKPAISHAKRLDYDRKQDISLLEVKIDTGRKHQIRKHLSQAGFPIIGDRLYGQGQTNEPDLMLTAVSLDLTLNDTPYHFQLPESLNQTLSDFQTIAGND